MEKEQEYYTATASTGDDDYFIGRKEGYEDGKKIAVRDFNDRLVVWLFVGMFAGLALGYYLSEGWVALLSILALIYLVEKLSKIKL